MANKGALEKMTKFFREVKAELKKVNWPNKKEMVSYTMVVVVTVLLVAAFIGLIDFGVSNIIRPIILN